MPQTTLLLPNPHLDEREPPRNLWMCFFFSVSIGRTSVFCMIFVNRILQVVKYERKKKVKVTLWL